MEWCKRREYPSRVFLDAHKKDTWRVYIHRHVFFPSQDSPVWLGLMSREQLMSPDCSKHQVLSFAKILVVWWMNKKYFVLISVLQSAQWINSEHIYPQTHKFHADTAAIFSQMNKMLNLQYHGQSGISAN